MPTTIRGMLKDIWSHPANANGRARAFVRMATWQARKRLIGKPYGLSVYGDMTFRAYPDSTQPGRFIYFGGLPDYEEMTFMRRYLRPGDGFIDGGANEGMFTLLAAKLVGPDGTVHAFEAAPTYVERLRENVKANRLNHVVIHADAIGAEPGQVSFVLRGTGSRIRTSEDHGQTVSVNVVRLYEALPNRTWAMGKLDVEGAEPLALAGAEKVIAQGQPAIWMLELVDSLTRRFGKTASEVRGWLGDQGYDLVLYEPKTNQLVAAPDPLWPLSDVLAVSRSSRHDVEVRLRESE